MSDRLLKTLAEDCYCADLDPHKMCVPCRAAAEITLLREENERLRGLLAEPEQDFNRVPLKIVRRGTVQWNTAETKLRCAVCGLDQTQIMGYVCTRDDCPTKVTCG